jgi:hypothetical protein
LTRTVPNVPCRLAVAEPEGVARNPRGRLTLISRLVAALAVATAIGMGSAAQACTDFAKAPHSRWSIEHGADASWLVTPCGARFFSLGVNAIDGGIGWRGKGNRIAYNWREFAPDLRSWAATTRARLRAWGFNTAGAWSLRTHILDLPTTPELELGRQLQFIWTDPFSPELPDRLAQLARTAIAPFRDDPKRIGYFTDNEIGWWNGPLFTAYAAYPASNHTKQRLIGLLRERYKDEWDAFVGDFVPPGGARSFDDLLRSDAAPRLRPGGSGIFAVRAWTRLFAARYYSTVHDAVRAADPDALILGDRLPIYYDQDAVRAMAPYVDAVSVNYNVDGPDGWIAPYFFDGLRELTGGKPILVSEWFFAAHENRSGNLNRTGEPHKPGLAVRSNNRNRTGHLMTVATQEQRALGAATAATRLIARPEVIGLHWFQFADEPHGGRDDGEDYNFGLVDIDDRPYAELVDALAAVAGNLEKEHGGARGDDVVGGAPMALPYAEINIGDDSLAEWPKPDSLVKLRAAPGEARFGDLHLAWSEHGLFLAIIAMDYYDPSLLAFAGEFPRNEAFRVGLGVDAGGGPARIELRVVPGAVARSQRDEMKLSFSIEICRASASPCETVPGAAASYFGTALDQPRVIAEALIPWASLGLDRPRAGRPLRLEAAITAFFRSRWMSSSGLPPAEAIARSEAWAPAVLGGAVTPRLSSSRSAR